MKEKIANTIGWIFIGILTFIAILILSVFIQTKVKPDKVPSIFGYKPFVVLSGSMESEIYEGDLVIVKNVNPSTLKENDIIAFRDEDNYVVTHRIVEINEVNGKLQFTTKGDNNNIEDSGYVSEDNVEGIYVSKITGAGNVVLTMQKPIALMITLIIIFVGGFIFIALDNSRMSASDKKELEEFRKNQRKDK